MSTQPWRPHGGLQADLQWQRKTQREAQGTLTRAPVARAVSAARKDTADVHHCQLLEFNALGSLGPQQLFKLGHTLLQFRILGWTETDPADSRVTQLEAVSQSPAQAATAAAGSLEV